MIVFGSLIFLLLLYVVYFCLITEKNKLPYNASLFNEYKYIIEQEYYDYSRSNRWIKQNNGLFIHMFHIKTNHTANKENIFYCPFTFELFSKLTNFQNVYVINIGPRGSFTYARNNNNVIYFVPIFVPAGATGISINNQFYNWNDVDALNPVKFDDKFSSYTIYNNTLSDTAIIAIE